MFIAHVTSSLVSDLRQRTSITTDESDAYLSDS